MLHNNTKSKNMPLVIYAVLLVIAIVAMIALKRCGNAQFGKSAVTALSGGDTLDVAIEYSPITYYTYNDTLGGFDYDLLRLISSQQQVPMKFHPIVTLQKALDGLHKGDYDLVAAQFPVTVSNKRLSLFTDPVYLDRQVLVQRKDDAGKVKLHSQLDLADCTLHIVKGSPMKERIEGLSREIGGDIHIVVDDVYGPEQLFLQVVTGEIDYAVMNETIAASLAKKYPGKVDTGTAISFSQFQSWVINKLNAELCNKFNHWLQQAKESPEYQQLVKRYLPNNHPNEL
jgi:ABC-type amino acid transport substrate-binding protein